MHDLEYLGKELKSSSNGSSLPPICIFLLALLTPAACFSLHLLIPGGLVHSHLLVVNSLSLLLCCAHLLLFMLIHNDGMTPKQVCIKMPCACGHAMSTYPDSHFSAFHCREVHHQSTINARFYFPCCWMHFSHLGHSSSVCQYSMLQQSCLVHMWSGK